MLRSSPSGVSGVPASLVASACSAAGGFRCGVRPSVRSFTGWVCVCYFCCRSVAVSFSVRVASALGVPFCSVRSALGGFGGFWSVSVPVFVVVRRVRRVGCRLGRRWFRCFGGGSGGGSGGSGGGLAGWFSGASVVGFSGSRSVVPSAAVRLAVSLVPAGVPVSVGCAGGVDGFVRSLLSGAGVPFSLFSVASGRWGRGRGAFAGRSAACVRSVGSGGLWVSFPSRSCPSGLVPSSSSSRCFSGSGSGSWASLAFAVGSGVPSLVFLGSLPCPSGWGFSAVPGCPGWFGFRPGGGQLSLF